MADNPSGIRWFAPELPWPHRASEIVSEQGANDANNDVHKDTFGTSHTATRTNNDVGTATHTNNDVHKDTRGISHTAAHETGIRWFTAELPWPHRASEIVSEEAANDTSNDVHEDTRGISYTAARETGIQTVRWFTASLPWPRLASEIVSEQGANDTSNDVHKDTSGTSRTAAHTNNDVHKDTPGTVTSHTTVHETGIRWFTAELPWPHRASNIVSQQTTEET